MKTKATLTINNTQIPITSTTLHTLLNKHIIHQPQTPIEHMKNRQIIQTILNYLTERRLLPNQKTLNKHYIGIHLEWDITPQQAEQTYNTIIKQITNLDTTTITYKTNKE